MSLNSAYSIEIFWVKLLYLFNPLECEFSYNIYTMHNKHKTLPWNFSFAFKNIELEYCECIGTG